MYQIGLHQLDFEFRIRKLYYNFASAHLMDHTNKEFGRRESAAAGASLTINEGAASNSNFSLGARNLEALLEDCKGGGSG